MGGCVAVPVRTDGDAASSTLGKVSNTHSEKGHSEEGKNSMNIPERLQALMV